jgi:hypothetical protein
VLPTTPHLAAPPAMHGGNGWSLRNYKSESAQINLKRQGVSTQVLKLKRNSIFEKSVPNLLVETQPDFVKALNALKTSILI